MSAELLPCPFCGAHLPEFASDEIDVKRHTIKCTECPGRAEFYSSTSSQAIAAWNRRAALAAKTEAVAPDWITYDERGDVLTIHGIKYAGDLMRQFGKHMPVNQPFAIEAREDGVLTILKLDWVVVQSAPTHCPP